MKLDPDPSSLTHLTLSADSKVDSADLTHPLVRDQTCFLDKIAVRKRLESHAQTHPSLGYTYVMTGISSDLLLDSNMLGLDDDRSSAAFLGSPDARVSTTHLDE